MKTKEIMMDITGGTTPPTKTIMTKTMLEYNMELMQKALKEIEEEEKVIDFSEWYVPGLGDEYNFIMTTGEITWEKNDSPSDTYRIKNNRVFRTLEETQAYQKIQEAKLRIEKYLVIENGTLTRDASLDYFIEYDKGNNELRVSFNELWNPFNVYLFHLRSAAEQFINEMHDDIMLVLGK